MTSFNKIGREMAEILMMKMSNIPVYLLYISFDFFNHQNPSRLKSDV